MIMSCPECHMGVMSLNEKPFREDETRWVFIYYCVCGHLWKDYDIRGTVIGEKKNDKETKDV